VVPVVAEFMASGRTSPCAITAELNGRGIPSPSGEAWSSVAVVRLVG